MDKLFFLIENNKNIEFATCDKTYAIETPIIPYGLLKIKIPPNRITDDKMWPYNRYMDFSLEYNLDANIT